MSDTTVSLLTAPGTGAIATIQVSGPRAWELARQLFKPAGKPLPEAPEVNRFWLGTLGNDEVILAVTGVEEPPHPPRRIASDAAATSPPHGGGEVGAAAHHAKLPGVAGAHTSPPPCGGEVAALRASGVAAGEGVFSSTIEVHCHGGRRVVRWVVEQFVALGCIERNPRPSGEGFDLLQHAPTLRTASILLDQFHGAFETAIRAILQLLTQQDIESARRFLQHLSRFAPVGRHLVEPWTVAVAGPPNVGKSSLVNALAGYQRAVVSEVAGTTRDAVSVRIALDGWPVELIDTAGLRDAEGLEAEGIERAKSVLENADLVLWVMDATRPEQAPSSPLIVWNKSDLLTVPPPGLTVSALTGAGLPALVAEITRRLVPHAPQPGVAVPFTPRLADLVEAAHAALAAGRADEAARLLRDCLPPG